MTFEKLQHTVGIVPAFEMKQHYLKFFEIYITIFHMWKSCNFYSYKIELSIKIKVQYTDNFTMQSKNHKIYAVT